MDGIGGKLKQSRVARGLTQHDVATQIGVARSTVSQWETGARAINVRNIIAYAKIVGVSLDFLVSDKRNILNEPPYYTRIKYSPKNNIIDELMHEIEKFV